MRSLYTSDCTFYLTSMCVLQAAPMWVNSSLLASCPWCHGDALGSNTQTTKLILMWWRRLTQSSINQAWRFTNHKDTRRLNWHIEIYICMKHLFQKSQCGFQNYLLFVKECILIVFSSGSTITAEIQGVIDACVKLTGMPDLTLSFMVCLQTFSFTLADSQQVISQGIYTIWLM